jgi:hypothetical protein
VLHASSWFEDVVHLIEGGKTKPITSWGGAMLSAAVSGSDNEEG